MVRLHEDLEIDGNFEGYNMSLILNIPFTKCYYNWKTSRSPLCQVQLTKGKAVFARIDSKHFQNRLVQCFINHYHKAVANKYLKALEAKTRHRSSLGLQLIHSGLHLATWQFLFHLLKIKVVRHICRNVSCSVQVLNTWNQMENKYEIESFLWLRI